MKKAVRHISYENRTDKYYSFSFCISWLSVFMSAVLENCNTDIHLYSDDVKNVLQLTGRKFIDIITGLKLQAGTALLETTDLSLDQISEIIGYNSGDYFSKSFRKRYGISASEYRKNHSSDQML